MCEEAGERVLRLGFSLPELRQGKLPKGKWASFDYAFGEVITINEKKPKGGWKKAVDEQYQNQWHSHKNPILHELGHYIHYSNDKFYENERWEKPGRYGVTTDDIGQLVSLYAKKSRTEFEAELMAGILSGKVYPESILRCSYMLEKKGSPDERNLFNDIWEIASGEKPNTLVTEQKYGDMMKVLYQQEGSQLKISIMAENDVQDFINAHAQVLDNGFKYLPMSDAMRHRLERSNFIFSGFKTFHELNEAFPSLIDENGERKPFERFLKDVLAIDETYNRNYLRAEYNFCQASADMAAKWEQIEADGDRYNLQYRTQHDDKVRPEHAALDGVTLPPSDPFWEEYYPPNGWNCRCTVAQVRKSKYPVTDPEEARARGEEALQKDTRGIFRFNSGKQGKTFPDYNPYTISRCRDCDIAQGKVNLAAPDNTQLCQACTIIRQMESLQRRPNAQEKRDIRDAANIWADRHLDTVKLETGPAKRTTIVNNNTGDNLIVGKKFFNETYTKNQYNRLLAETMRLATEFGEWLPDATYTGNEPGNHHNHSFKVYETSYHGVRIVCKVKDLPDGLYVYTMRIYH